VIPGLSSALAAPVLAGIPTTLRGVADRVVVATGVGRKGTRPDLPAYRPDTTLVLLMAVQRSDTLGDELAAAGWPADCPAVWIERAGWPDQRVVTLTVETLGTVRVEAPACLVVGRVATPVAALRRVEAVAGEKAAPGRGSP
jgi:uroporphyrin-III C-methyltransferase